MRRSAVHEFVAWCARDRTCVLRGSPCDVSGTCAVHDTFVRGEDAVLNVLRQTTLHDIVVRKP